jgi:hypothetical protein
MAEDAETVKAAREVVVEALRFTDGLQGAIPDLLDHGRVDATVRRISREMRQRLSRPTCFATLQTLSRLTEFAEEHEDARIWDKHFSLMSDPA